jgi:uncharacterized membrane protein YebE (DUF533 family)
LQPINSTDDNEFKKTIIKTLIGLSKSDGEIHEQEALFVLDAGKSWGFSNDQIRDWIDEKDLEIKIPATEQERMTIVYYLLFLSKQDSALHKAEENFIYHFGFKLGFNESMLRDMVALFKEKHTTQIHPLELLNIIKKYLN